MLDFGFTPEQDLLRRTIRDFARRELAPHYTEWDRTETFPQHLCRRMGDVGILGMGLPVEYGGQGADGVTNGIAMEEVARGDFNLGQLPLLSSLCGTVVVKHATEELKRQWLPPVIAGEKTLALALTEPNAGSDAASLTATAVRDGDDYLITGEKNSVSIVFADAYLVFARVGSAPRARAITTFLVPAGLPGLTRGAFRDMGARGVPRGWIAMDQVRVPKEYRLGEEGQGFYSVMRGFDYSRALIGLMCLGAAQASLDETIEHTKQRQAFGQPLARFQGASFQIAEQATLIEAARLLCYKSLWLRDHDMPNTKESAMVKWWVPKVSVQTIQMAVLLHGHYGYAEELPLAQRMRDVFGWQIGDGSAEVQKIVVSRELMGRQFLPY